MSITRVLTRSLTLGLATAATVVLPGVASAADDVVSEEIVACADGVCSMGDAGTYSITRAGNILTVSGVANADGWSCETNVVTGRQTRIECLDGEGTKIISQAEVKRGVSISKVRVKLV